MKPLSLIIAQSDPRSLESLANKLGEHFKSVATARTVDELRHSVAKHRADVAIVDLSAASLLEVDELHRAFPQLTIVCTHRLADEQLWSAALSVGAQDCCHPTDVRGIVHAASHTVVMARTTAA